jgi:serine/arginine repetitive matrix protein 2
MTLSDIIPLPSHAHSLSSSSMMDDDSVLKSIFAKAADVPVARVRVDYHSSSKRQVRGPRGRARTRGALLGSVLLGSSRLKR